MSTKVSPFGGSHSGICVFLVEVRSSLEGGALVEHSVWSKIISEGKLKIVVNAEQSENISLIFFNYEVLKFDRSSAVKDSQP